MSLKAKIEAVIYAAEEPVTLAQLAFLFGGEVLALQSPAAGSAAEQSSDPPSQQLLTSELESALAEDLGPGSSSNSMSAGGVSGAGDHSGSNGVVAGDARAEGPSSGGVLADAVAPGSSEDAPAATLDAAIEERRAGRIRDRAIRDGLRVIVAELIEEYAGSDRGMEIREIAGGYRVATKPEYHDAVRSFVKSLKPPMKLSLQALETLAVIAYKQPVTAPEVSEIRGVDSGGVLGSLMSRKLITTAGRKQVIGRPILYKTTKEFLLRFGLRDVNELPSIEEFEKMAGDMEVEDAGEVVERELPFEAEAGTSGDDAAGFDGDTGEAGAADANGSDAAEANAGEPGVAVSVPDESPVANAAPTTGGPEVVELDSHLDSHLAAGPTGEHNAELITAVHPSTTVGGE